ncbi:MAG: hypothetical protein HETSPECPRED_003602 [Heterodermia speciosa]|uniref:Uncharacterized protein n=1 Tax=Heterodermia speciosa TaxID=116794 RepID=A0A8H3F646_9LECA|nr:MAG: hypothetical protein HETSPECPRED_003602 [Heterodermia speciosa]
MSTSRSSSPSKDDLDEISRISKQLAQARKDLNKQARVAEEQARVAVEQGRIAKEAIEAREQLKTALAESRLKEEETSERLIDAEEAVSKWKRLATKLKEQSAAPQVDSALVGDLQARLKHSEEERQKAAHELRQTQEELKSANEKLGALRVALEEYVTSVENLLPGGIKGAITDVPSKALSQALPGQLSQYNQSRPTTDVLVKSQPGNIQLKVDEVASLTHTTACSANSLTAGPQINQQALDTAKGVIDATASCQDLKGEPQLLKTACSDPSTDLKIQNPFTGKLYYRSGGKTKQVPGIKEQFDGGESSASGTQETKSIFKDSSKVIFDNPFKFFFKDPSKSIFENPSKSIFKDASWASITSKPTKNPTRLSQSSIPLQDPEFSPIPTKAMPIFPAAETQVTTTVSAAQDKPSSEKPKVSAAPVLKTPAETQSAFSLFPDDFDTDNPSQFRKDRITAETFLARWSEGPQIWVPESDAHHFTFSGQTSASLAKSEDRGAKRQGSPLQSPRERQKRS